MVWPSRIRFIFTIDHNKRFLSVFIGMSANFMSAFMSAVSLKSSITLEIDILFQFIFEIQKDISE